MPTVPFQPYGNVQPSGEGIRSVHVDSPVQAFGGAVGKALEGFGSQLEKSSDEIFKRAIAIQDLRNETEAKEADADYMVKAGELHANFSALQGKNAADAYPGYVKQLQELRKTMRNGLPNDMSRKLFDSQSLSTMGRTIFNGAGHAATQNKKWAFDTAQSRIDAEVDRTKSNPDDPKAFDEGVQRVEAETRHQEDLKGQPDEQAVTSAISKNTSKLYSELVIATARKSPFKAEELLNKYRGKIRGQDIDRVIKAVDDAKHETGSRVIANNLQAGWDPGMPQKDIDKTVGIEKSLTDVIQAAQKAHPELRIGIGDRADSRDGRTISLKPYGKVLDGEAYEKIDNAIKEAAKKLGIPVESVGDEHGNWRLSKDYDVSKAPKVPPESLQSKIDRAQAEVKRLAPDDVRWHETVGDRVTSVNNKHKEVERQELNNRLNTMASGLNGDFTGGKLPTTTEELKASSPEVQKAYEELDPIHQGRINKQLALNAKGAKLESDFRRVQELKGLAENDPEKFLNTDLMNEPLGTKERGQLLQLQRQKMKDAQQDPRVQRALNNNQSILQAAGVTKKASPDEFNVFTGALQDQLQQFISENKRAPKLEEERLIVNRLLQDQIVQPHKWFEQSEIKEKTFQLKIPDEEIEKIKSDPEWAKQGITPDDAMINRIYVRKRYKELYPGKGDGAKPDFNQTFQDAAPKGGVRAVTTSTEKPVDPTWKKLQEEAK